MLRQFFSVNKKALRSFSTSSPNDVVLVSYARTPIATFGGSFKSLQAPDLAAVAISAAIERANISKSDVQEAYLGNVVSAGIGQAPTRQAILKAGLPTSVPCTTINKVCASGMKSIAMAAQSIASGANDIMLAGGFESMTNVPYYLPAARAGYRLGNGSVIDGVVHDGLWDPYNNQHMGMCGEACAESFDISREEQDSYAIDSYAKAAAAAEAGKFADEITPVSIRQRKGPGAVFNTDEEISNTSVDKIRKLRPAFKKENGTVTAANASSLNDGAAAMVLMSAGKAKELNLKPLARIRGFGDAARDPVEFTIAPSDAVPVALARSGGLTLKDVEYHEINEAFSVVALANIKKMGLDPARVNVNGGAVALGHPIGMSGTRIVGALYHVLKQNDATIGCASICNGGGGAGAMVIERLN